MDDKCLVTMSFRAVAQRPAQFFLDHSDGIFGDHDDHFWSGNDDDEDKGESAAANLDEMRYRSLFCLVNHEERRQDMDVATKAIFAVFLLKCLEVSGYFGSDVGDDAKVKVGKVLFQFLKGFQFNTHMVEGIYSNRLISSQDAETRIWKDARM